MSTDTAPIRPDEKFDEGAVADYLREHLPDNFGHGPIDFEQFPGGRANLTYLARSGDKEVVVRRPPLGPVAPGAHDMAREFRVLSVLWRVFPVAPRAFHLCQDEAVMGKAFFVMERRRGIVVRDSWPDALGPAARDAAATGLIDTLAFLHSVDFEALGLSDLGRPDGFVQRQAAGWRDRWDRAKTRSSGDMDKASRLLTRGAPQPQKASLLHNDFKLDNVMLDDEGGVVAVFDWDMATLGDPLVDLGTLVAYWAEPGDATAGVFGGSVAELAPYLSRDQVVERYAAASGLDLADFSYYLGLAYYRIAVIIEQLYSRYLAGETQDERFAHLGELVPGLASAAVSSLAS